MPQRRYRSVRAATEGTESDWQKRITDYASAHGWMWAHIPSSKYGAGDPGFPDLVLVRDERTIFAEVKLPRGQMSWEQGFWQTALLNAGHEFYLWYPRDWEAIKELLA